MLTNTLKNIVSLLLGIIFSYLFLVFSSLVAQLPVPVVLQGYDALTVNYYSNTLMSFLSAFVSFILLLIIRLWFIQFTWQNVCFFLLPILLFFVFLFVFMSLALAHLLYAAIPTVIFAIAFTRSDPINHQVK